MTLSIINLLAALAFLNNGNLPQVENRSAFLTHVAKCSIFESKEAEAGTLAALLQHVHTDEKRAEAFVSWISMIADRYIKKIREKEQLPIMITYKLVLEFFFDTCLYKTQSDWNSIIENFDLSLLSETDKNIFETIFIPYLQEAPTVERVHQALRNVYQLRLTDPEVKERVKAFFVRISLPFFAWRLKQHIDKMSANPYLVARGERTVEYITKQYNKEQAQLTVQA